MATEAARRKAAGAFAEEWQGRGYEKSETQAFWLRLLQEVCGVEAPERIISFEKGVKLANAAFISHAAPNGGAASGACFIDAIIPSTHVLIEQKGRGHDLLKPQKQSDGPCSPRSSRQGATPSSSPGPSARAGSWRS